MHDSSSESALWRAVILQAIADATLARASQLVGPTTDRLMDVVRAREWLLKPSAPFNQVCALADLEPDRVRALAKRKIAEFEAAPVRRKVRRDSAVVYA